MGISIKDLVSVPREVNLGRGVAKVYGLDIPQVVNLLLQHGDNLKSFFTEGVKPDMQELLTIMPELSVQLIAMGLRAEGQEEDIRGIPLASQIEILVNVWELSVPDLGKLKARLSGLVEVAKAQGLQSSPSP